MPEPATDFNVLAFDFGSQQIGTAIGQTLTGSARALTVLGARHGQPDWEQVAKLIDEWRPKLLVVGLPLNMDDSESDFCRRARRFGRRLQGRFGLQVRMVDERLSTREAKDRGGRRESYRRDPVDNLAAQVILETWLADPDSGLAP